MKSEMKMLKDTGRDKIYELIGVEENTIGRLSIGDDNDSEKLAYSLLSEEEKNIRVIDTNKPYDNQIMQVR